MTAFIHTDYLDSASTKGFIDPYEAVLMECGRLIHAAVISKRFLNFLLTNPLKCIENGFCGEHFSFTHEEKKHIQHIQANTLAEFSNLLLQAVKQPYCIPAAPEMAYARLDVKKER